MMRIENKYTEQDKVLLSSDFIKCLLVYDILDIVVHTTIISVFVWFNMESDLQD